MVLVGMVADHERIGADIAKAVAFVEAAGAVIVAVDREIEFPRADAPRLVERPVHQALGDAGAMPR